MKLDIPYLFCQSKGLGNLPDRMGLQEFHSLNYFPWGAASRSPSVRFKLAHGTHCIFLLYDVWENETLARFSKHNAPVYKDSCVEFFIRFEGEQNYYNLEFNCLGTCLAAWGPDRGNRELLVPEVINQIKTNTKISRNDTEVVPLIHWQLGLKIPLAVFAYSNILQFTRQKAIANFCKCGDDLSNPHYVSWSNIKTPMPDFHQPGYFGELTFL